MDFFLGLLVRLALLVFGIWLFIKARRLAKRVKGMPFVWSRRFAVFFLFAPLLAWLGMWLFKAPIVHFFELLGAIGRGLDALVASMAGATEENLGFWWKVCLQPLSVAVIYALAGFLVGWPLDYFAWKKRKAAAAEEEAVPPAPA